MASTCMMAIYNDILMLSLLFSVSLLLSPCDEMFSGFNLFYIGKKSVISFWVHWYLRIIQESRINQ